VVNPLPKSAAAHLFEHLCANLLSGKDWTLEVVNAWRDQYDQVPGDVGDESHADEPFTSPRIEDPPGRHDLPG
jgi:hypothetical protein